MFDRIKRISYLIVAAALALFTCATLVWAFAEEPLTFRDPYTGQTGPEWEEVSTIHNDLTYALALAAGFSISDSITLQVYCQLVDSEQIGPGEAVSYTNCTGGAFYPTPNPYRPDVCRRNYVQVAWPRWEDMQSPTSCTTSRFGPYSPFFHFPHNNERELGALHDWAWGLTDTLTAYEAYAWGGPTVMKADCLYTRTAVITTGMEAGSLEAFGTYLHSLADYYSHRECLAAMDDLGMPWATHPLTGVPACNYNPFDPQPDDVHGREFYTYTDSLRTDEAIRHVYDELVARSLQREGRYDPIALEAPISGTETLSQMLHTFVHAWDFEQPAKRREQADRIAAVVLDLRRPTWRIYLPLLMKRRSADVELPQPAPPHRPTRATTRPRRRRAAPRTPPSGLIPIDVDLPSPSTGSPTGTLAVRVHTPRFGNARYPEGAPVLIWGAGGYEANGLGHGLPAGVDDVIIVSFLFPGGEDVGAGLASDGTYDYRGLNAIAAMRDVIRYAAGDLRDDQGRTIDDVVPVPVLHDNVGLEGVSNGGNIVVAVAALHGQDLAGHLRYVIQWETPASSQTATRDFGRVIMKPSPVQGDFVNPRYGGYGAAVLPSDYSDLAYDPGDPHYPVFHDGTGDGTYTTRRDPVTDLQTPDLDLDGVLSLTEDFPLDTYPHPGGTLEVYSRAVNQALLDQNVFTGTWPADVANPGQADRYWDIRESVRLYGDALTKLPNLEAMVLCGVRDHVQSLPDKPHVHQAFDGWHDNGAWVRINPSPTYLIEADPGLAGRDDLPNRVPNRPPADWTAADTYAIPEDVHKSAYQLAAVYQMADRAQGVLKPAPAGADLITYVDSEDDRIAVRVEVPELPRYPEGAPVVVEASTWFVPGDDFHRVNDTTRIGAVTVSYLWPERTDTASGARSEGVYDYGGPRSLEVLRDVIRFASGSMPNVAGHTIQDLIATEMLTENVGLFASSHAGVVATNVLAHHGSQLPRVKYLVGRENPTRDEMYPCELGHFDDLHNPVYNPFFDESAYSPITVTVDYATVGWHEDPHGMNRPYFQAGHGHPAYVLGEKGPRLWDGKRYYSRALTRALLESPDLTPQTWPEDVATYTETVEAWPFRTTVRNYPTFIAQAPDLKVMLVFASSDHVQAPQTKPHIHQAWDGFRHTAGLWVRMNPDLSYVQAINPSLGSGFPDNPANAEPADWGDIASWGFSAAPLPDVRKDVWLASVAEMADRVREDNWHQENLDGVLVHYPPQRLFLPLILRAYPTAEDSAPGSVDVNTPDAFEGYTLLAPLQSEETYLIDNQGEVVRTWGSDYKPGNVAYLLEGGDLLRAAMLEEPSRLNGGGAGGRVERFGWDGDLLWYVEYAGQDHRSHHDVELLPNGNLLMIAWEYKSPAEAVAAGCRPGLAQNGLWPDQIVEVAPSKEIVWAWRVWDHLIQDYDAGQENYGAVGDHPERIDLNYRTGQGADWNHVNGIDYNATFDQILLSVRQFNEIWIIDHGTTITEARGPEGDLLYRWGNPQAHRGDGEQRLFGQHDAHWIEEGLDGEGNVLLFNNGVGREPPYSSVDEIVLPVDAGGVYADLEATITWSYDLPGELTSLKISGAQRLPNGNTLICSGDPGVILEVTREGKIAWRYSLAPVSGDAASGTPAEGRDDIFRAYRYGPDALPAGSR